LGISLRLNGYSQAPSELKPRELKLLLSMAPSWAFCWLFRVLRLKEAMLLDLHSFIHLSIFHCVLRLISSVRCGSMLHLTLCHQPLDALKILALLCDVLLLLIDENLVAPFARPVGSWWP